MIRTDRPHLEVVVTSQTGKVRTSNEDRYAVGAYLRSQRDDTPCTLAVVSDGIGGHAAGEVAAETVVAQLRAVLEASEALDPPTEVREALLAASRAVFERSTTDVNLRGMGATAALAWVVGNRLYTGTVGDSRIHLLRQSRLHQISVDHTYVQEAVESGTMTVEEARTHPYAHVLRRHLGSEKDPLPDLRLRLDPSDDDALAVSQQGTPLARNEVVLLCTDGLSDLVRPEEIEFALLTQPLQAAVSTLINTALDRGGYDNITVLAMRQP